MDLDLEILDPKDFPKVYDIAKEAFPPSETRPYEEARALLDDPQFNIHVVKSEERKIGGFLVIWDFPTFNFMELFAIRKNMRGLGLGSAALKLYLKDTSQPLILEVESYDTPIAKRRIKFYERLGFTLNDINYLQPPMRENAPDVPLMVMSHPEPIAENRQEKLTAQIFRTVYGVDEPLELLAT
ncbi:MAG TPA: N-acetyltransferase [Firmicutes bacterium]|jgi:ribosomal protein S18 acetylase RimI-like enzyme|nr:N-acetyltransferase [Bacillota bacterium]